MSHDLEASFAATELVNLLVGSPDNCFETPPPVSRLSGNAAREGRHTWPHSDGVIQLVESSSSTRGRASIYNIALEFKRPNEGLHGVLTAIGQAHAYLKKGYVGTAIVIPESYSNLDNPGTYVNEVLEQTSKSECIGVFTYSKPDLSKVSPFKGALRIHRRFKIDLAVPISGVTQPMGTETQWAHVREGSTEPDAFFKYLQCLKQLGGDGIEPYTPYIPEELIGACERLRADCNPETYLSSCPKNELPDKAWRRFWFKYVLHPGLIKGWSLDGDRKYVPNAALSLIEKFDGSGLKKFFSGRSDSPKDEICRELNSETVSLYKAFENLAKNYNGRAHSYREDIDSGCEDLGFIDGKGRLTNIGYKFVDACERYGNPNFGIPRTIFLRAMVNEGGLGAFLHYVYRLSEERFSENPLAFTDTPPGSKFLSSAYLSWLEGQMKTELKVIKKVSLRGGAERPPFQAELAILRNLGMVKKSFRIGVGIVINWPELLDAMRVSE